MSSTIDRLTDVFRDVFEDDDITLTRATTAKDIAEWDSLMNVALMLNVEQSFGVHFNSSEVSGLKDVGGLIDLLDARMGAK